MVDLERFKNSFRSSTVKPLWHHLFTNPQLEAFTRHLRKFPSETPSFVISPNESQKLAFLSLCSMLFWSLFMQSQSDYAINRLKENDECYQAAVSTATTSSKLSFSFGKNLSIKILLHFSGGWMGMCEWVWGKPSQPALYILREMHWKQNWKLHNCFATAAAAFNVVESETNEKRMPSFYFQQRLATWFNDWKIIGHQSFEKGFSHFFALLIVSI